MHRQFHPQIAARHHDAVRHLEDFGERPHRGRLFDLGQDGGTAPGQFARLKHILGTLDKGQRQPVHPELAGELQILAVLVGQRGQRQHHIGDIDPLAVGDRPAGGDHAIGEIGAAAFDPQADLAVVDQKLGLRPQRGKDLGMRQLHAIGTARRGIEVKAEGLALGQVMRPLGKGSHAQLRPLQIGQNRDRAT